jgi:hypothetical protein
VYKGFGAFAMVISNAPQLKDVHIDHVTALPNRVAFIVGADRNKPLPTNFSVTNSILNAGERDVTSTGGGPQNCAYGVVQLGPEAIFQNCFHEMTFAHNAIISPGKSWPKGNSFPKNEDAVGFVRANHGKEGDYRLCPEKDKPSPCKKASPFHQSGSDGKDTGADVEAVAAATKDVD